MNAAGIVGEYENWSMVVLYDALSGQVAHTHQCVTTRGGTHPDPATLEREARAHAASAHGTQALSALHVDPRTVAPDTLYKVDPAKGTLVATSARPGKK